MEKIDIGLGGLMRCVLCIFLALLTCSTVFGQSPGPSSKEMYQAPPDLEASFSPNGPEGGDSVKLAGKLAAATGNLRNVKVWFTASPDLQVKPLDPLPQALKQGKKTTLRVEVSPSRSGKGTRRTWVKMHVSYLPDFASVAKAVEKNEEEYPEPYLRDVLLKKIRAAGAKSGKKTLVVGHRFLLPPFGEK